jgi:FkbM family methyltransferase
MARRLQELPAFAWRHTQWAVRDRFPRRKVVREVQGVRMVLPWAHRLPDYARGDSAYGQNLVHLAARLAAAGTEPLTVLDIGANVGDSALQILNAADARVLCVEGDPFYLDFLHLNVDADPRVSVVEALLVVGDAPPAGTAIRTGGTTRFAHGEVQDGLASISTDELRVANPDFARLRLAKSDTDGFDVTLIPAVAEVWSDEPPVLFFEYDHRLSRLAGNDPYEVWARLAGLGYHDVAVWDNGGRPLGRTTVDEVVAQAAVLDRSFDERGVHYWDVAVAHGEDSVASEVLAELVPAPMDSRS